MGTLARAKDAAENALKTAEEDNQRLTVQAKSLEESLQTSQFNENMLSNQLKRAESRYANSSAELEDALGALEQSKKQVRWDSAASSSVASADPWSARETERAERRDRKESGR